MNPTALSMQSHIQHKLDQYRHEADTERLLREPKGGKDDGQARKATTQRRFGWTLQLLR